LSFSKPLAPCPRDGICLSRLVAVLFPRDPLDDFPSKTYSIPAYLTWNIHADTFSLAALLQTWSGQRPVLFCALRMLTLVPPKREAVHGAQNSRFGAQWVFPSVSFGDPLTGAVPSSLQTLFTFAFVFTFASFYSSRLPGAFT